MNGGQLFAMFRSFADESDDTFLTDTQIAAYLEQGYREYRNVVATGDPSIYLTTAIVTGTGTGNSIDLATTVPAYLGSTAAAGTKIDRLLRVGDISSASDDTITGYLEAAPNELAVPAFGYCLSGTKLIFGAVRAGSYRIEYIPTFDFAAVFSGTSTAYIDDLEAFHVLIVLFALRYYAIRDGAASPEVERQLQAKLTEFQWYLAEGRNQATRYVVTADNNF